MAGILTVAVQRVGFAVEPAGLRIALVAVIGAYLSVNFWLLSDERIERQE